MTRKTITIYINISEQNAYIYFVVKMLVEDVLGGHKEKGKFRKDLQDILQYSMSRRMPRISPMLLFLPRMIKITRKQLNVL